MHACMNSSLHPALSLRTDHLISLPFVNIQFIPNPSKGDASSLRHFHFLGILMGFAALHNCPLQLNFPQYFWKKLVTSIFLLLPSLLWLWWASAVSHGAVETHLSACRTLQAHEEVTREDYNQDIEDLSWLNPEDALESCLCLFPHHVLLLCI